MATTTAPPDSQAMADRLRVTNWLNARLGIGVLFMLIAVLGGALFLLRLQQLSPVYVAARDLPSSSTLGPGDLRVVRARMPAAQLRTYLQPVVGRSYVGQVLTTSLTVDAFVPRGSLVLSAADANMVVAPIKAEPADMAPGLRPGERVQVVAAYTDGERRGQAAVLLDSVEVVQVLKDTSGLAVGSDTIGVAVRMPRDQAQPVAAASISARILINRTAAPPTPASTGTNGNVGSTTGSATSTTSRP